MKYFYCLLILCTSIIVSMGSKIISEDDRQELIKDARSKKLLVVLEEGAGVDSTNAFIKNAVTKHWKFNDSIQFLKLSEVKKIYESGNKDYVVLQLGAYSSGEGQGPNYNTTVLAYNRIRAQDEYRRKDGARISTRWEFFYIKKSKWFLYNSAGVFGKDNIQMSFFMTQSKLDKPCAILYLKMVNAHVMSDLNGSQIPYEKRSCSLLAKKTLLIPRILLKLKKEEVVNTFYDYKCKIASDSDMVNAIMHPDDTTAILVLNQAHYLVSTQDGLVLNLVAPFKYSYDINGVVLKSFMECK